MTASAQRHALRDVLARLELVSTAPTSRYDADGGGGDDGDGAPSGGPSPAERFTGRLNGIDAGLRRRVAGCEAIGAGDARERERRSALVWWVTARDGVLRDAVQTLADLTGRDGVEPTRTDAAMDEPSGVEAAVLEDAPGTPAVIVADRLGLSVFAVRRIYVGAALDPEDGTTLTTIADDRAGRVAELRAKGMTSRQIATLLGLHQTQVARLMRRAV